LPSFLIDTLHFGLSEDQITSRLHADLPLVVLGSIIAAIGLAALVIAAFRWRSRERVLLWFGLFAGPYGVRLLTNSFTFQLAFGHPRTFWLIIGRLVDFATIVPALLLFEEFYGKGWRSSVRWLIWGYVVFATVAFTNIVIQNNPGPSGWNWNCFSVAADSPAGTAGRISASARPRSRCSLLGITYLVSDIRARSHSERRVAELARPD